MTARTIDLGSYAKKGVGILAGREFGRDVREEEGLDQIDASRDPSTEVRVVIPSRIYAVNSSFFLGMFEKSITELGTTEFRRRYRFEGRDAQETLEEGIRIAQLFGTSLTGRHR